MQNQHKFSLWFTTYRSLDEYLKLRLWEADWDVSAGISIEETHDSPYVKELSDILEVHTGSIPSHKYLAGII